MKNLKISFLIPAHNEEKVISLALKRLSELEYSNFEVLVGLDRCSDNTKLIVKSFSKKIKNLKYYDLRSPNGKPYVIDYLIKKSSGEIIIIHDADWHLNVVKKEPFKDLIGKFDDKEIGGIAETFPVEYPAPKNSNYWYKVVAQSHYYWMKYQIENRTYKNKHLYIKDTVMFLTNIFRKNLYESNYSLADDFERTHNILKSGMKIVIIDDISYPRFISSYSKIKLRDLFRQKRRTAIARNQLQINEDLKLPFKQYTFPVLLYMIKKSIRKNLSTGIKILLWIFINVLAKLTTIFSSHSTKKGWTMRVSR